MPSRLRWIVPLALLVTLTLASYGPALEAGFVELDDSGYVEGNPPVATGLRWENVRWAVTGYQLANWHPLTWVSHMVDVELYGLEPRGHHATSLILHLGNVLLLFFVLRSLTQETTPSLVVAGLFALHPSNVESVAWIAQRKTLLSTFFALLSIWSYARYARGGGRLPYLGSLAALALSLLSKQMFVSMGFALLLLDYWPLRRAELEPELGRLPTLAAIARGWLRLLPEKLPYLLLAGLAAAITIHSQQDAMSPVDAYPISVRLENVAVSYVRYIASFLAPARLAVFYPLYTEDLTPWRVGGAAALLVAVTAAMLRLGLRRRHLLVGWLWFLGTLVPVVGLVQVGMQSIADRYVYVPFWGLAIILVWSVRDLLRLRPSGAARVLVGAAVVVTACGAAYLTHRQAETWKNSFTLFEHAVANVDRNWMAHSFLAGRYFARGDFQQAIAHSEAALEFGRDMGSVRSTYGLALYETGSKEKALEQFQLATIQAPDDPLGFMHLGWLHTEKGEYGLALVRLATAADKIKSTTPPYTRKMIYANWANALAKTNQLEASREKYELALAIEPASAILLRDAARVDLRLGDSARASERLRRVLEKDDGDAEASSLLASAHVLAGDAEAAASIFHAVLVADPKRVGVPIELARTLAQEGRREDANRLLQALLEVPPPANDADARFLTSTVLAQRAEIALEAGDLAGALGDLDHALSVWPANYDANNRLAWLLATSADPVVRDPARAVILAERAISERREIGSLSTLAAAYAAAGRLPAAVAVAREALELAVKANDTTAVPALEHQLRVYGEAAPVHSAPPSQ